MALSNSNIPLTAPDSTTPTTLSIRQAFGQTRTEVQGLIDAVNAGVQGPQGASGTQGSQGAQGAQGASGGQGAQGAAGAQGTAGTPGSGGAATAIIGDPATTPTGAHPDGTLLIDQNSGALFFKLGTGWIDVVAPNP